MAFLPPNIIYIDPYNTPNMALEEVVAKGTDAFLRNPSKAAPKSIYYE